MNLLNITDDFLSRNPWGKIKKGNWEGPWSDGSKEFTPEAQIELNHKFGNDSVFWISYQDLLRKYQHFERTRLFMDSPDWRLTQEWISVEVPWRSEFEQKFIITLKRESPIVLVMSQLDYRYFEGLQGQYTFRLQFRLHEANSPEEEDYIVRSHGNYLMNRSVVTELKSLPAGRYTVFMMVVAERNKGLPSVEDVVREELRRKEDNEKLAQVGTAYDLAHNKGFSHMKARVNFRKTRDKVKARESRIAQRRVLWEKRHSTREIVRKQNKKNREKREGKQVKHAKEAEKEKESKPKDQGVQTEDITKAKVERQDKSIQTEDPLDESTSNLVDTQTLNERDKAVQTEDLTPSSNESQATPVTPKSNGSSPHSQHTMVSERHHGPPPPPSGYHPRGSVNSPNFGRGIPPPRPEPYVTSEGESSASPVSDYDMYSDDDPTLKPRNPSNEAKPPKEKDDEEDEAEPWNAVCIVGFRVYSKDEGLVLTVCEEGMEEEITGPKDDDAGTDGDVEDAGDEDDAEKKRGDAKYGKLKNATTGNDSLQSVETEVGPEEDSKAVITSDSSEMIIAPAAKTYLLADDAAKETSQDEELQVNDLEATEPGKIQDNLIPVISEISNGDAAKETSS